MPREPAQPRAQAAEADPPVQDANKAAENIARVAGGESAAKPVQVVKTEVNDPYRSLTATPMLAASVLAVVLLTFFFMVVYGHGSAAQRAGAAAGHRRRNGSRWRSCTRSNRGQRDVLTISVINAVVGLAFAGMPAGILGLPLTKPLLWGTMAGC